MSLQEFALEHIILILAVAIALVTVWKGVKVVPQSEVYVVERFGRYTRTLQAESVVGIERVTIQRRREARSLSDPIRG